MESGGLVPNEMVGKIVQERVSQSDCANGYLLDGFPRTMEQVSILERTILRDEQLSAILLLEAPIAVLGERICGRWVHKASGRS